MESRNKMTMCRLCLGENKCFLNIFEVNDCQGYVAAKVISELLQFQVSETDIYPQVVCSECLLKLTDFKLFKECCQRSKVKYDNMFVASENMEKHKPEMDVGDGGSGLEFCEQDPLREETSDSIIKKEELDISGDESEDPCKGTNTKVSFGPMLLKHEVLSFNRDSDTQDVGGYRSDSEQSEQDPLGDASSHCKRTVYYNTVDKIKKHVQLLDQYGDEEGEQLRTNVQKYCQSTKDSRKKGVKGNQNKTASFMEGIHTQDAAYTCRDHHKSPVSTKCSEQKRPNCESKGEVDIDSCTTNVIISDKSIFEKSKNISSSSEIEATPSGMINRLDDQLILSGERIYTTPLLKRVIVIKKGRRRKGKKTGGEGEERRDTAPGKEVKKEIERFKCYHCGNMFISKRGLKQHMILHGFGKSYPCEVCDKIFQSVGNLNRHILTHTGSKPHKCVKCDKSFSLTQNLKKHMTTHTGLKPYKCVKCSSSFRRSDTLKTHMRSHSGSKPYKCADCSKSFYQIGHLKGHMRLHTGSKPYKCTECSKCFSRSDNLTLHMRTHTGDKPYKCADCNKCFIANYGLKTHMRSHTGSKPYKCVECGKSFSQSSALASHKRSHAGVKPYKCVECSKSFSQSGSLKSHMRAHAGVKPYKCSECGNCFTRNAHLITHMRIHTGSKPYKCAECCKCFGDKSHFNKHMRSKTCIKSREVAEGIKSLSK